MSQHLDRQQLRRLWDYAIEEDGAEQDLTSLVVLDEASAGSARIVARQAGVFAGEVVLDCVREAHAPRVTVEAQLRDGEPLSDGALLATLAGPMRRLLGIERTLLNFLQRLCGVATVTRRYVDAVAGTNARIYDTRKTIPGWRQLDKYAVRCGGGENHRRGLHDAVLIKDNHLAGIETGRLASVAFEMLNEAASLRPAPRFVEFEVDTLEQLDELLKVVGIDVILLDNFTPQELREAVARRDGLGLAGKVELEASGGVDLDCVRAIAEAGVDRIAVGAVTHSAPGLDIGMDVEAKHGSRP